VDNGKQNTDENKGTQEEYRHGWQHVKKRKRIHQNIESSTRINPEISTHNRYTPLLNKHVNEESPQTSIHSDAPLFPRSPPIFVYGVKNFKAMLDDLADVPEPNTYRTTALANGTVKINANTIDTYRSLAKHMKEENIVHHTYQIKTELLSDTFTTLYLQKTSKKSYKLKVTRSEK